MAAGDDDGEAVKHEDFLWSLGVGSALPEWLKEQRHRERAAGLNQEARARPAAPARPGIGPQGPWGGEAAAPPGTEAPAPRASPVAAPAARSSGPPPAPARAAGPREVQVPTAAAAARPGAYGGAAERGAAERGAYDGGAAPRGGVAPPLASTLGSAVSSSVPAPPMRTNRPAQTNFGMSIKEWLQTLDESGFLSQYHDCIAARLDSLEQLVDVYVNPDGELDVRFFDDTGIKKLGHKRLFEKWFRDHRR